MLQTCSGRAAARSIAMPEARNSGTPALYQDREFNTTAAKIGPGEYYVTQRDMLIVTVLGSCVSACVRDPVTRIGGMNHFMLPEQGGDPDSPLSGSARYGAFAMEILINNLLSMGAHRNRLQAKLFGAGRIVPGMSDIGRRNAMFAQEYLRRENVPILADDLGNSHPSKVYFFPHTGRVLVKRLKTLKNDTILTREQIYARRLEQLPVSGGDAHLFT
jgi:chemotaxis protein CheD